MDKNKAKKGFTLIEATLGIAFLSILLITIAILINAILSSYRKGVTIKTINSVGRDLIEDMTTAVAASPTKDLVSSCSLAYPYQSSSYNACVADHAYKFTYSQQESSNIYIDGKKINQSVPISGAFCTGKYSYVWNTGYVLGEEYSGGSKSPLTYLIKNDAGNTVTVVDSDFRLLKVIDPLRIVCASRLNINPDDPTEEQTYDFIGDNSYDITKDLSGGEYILSEKPTELLAANTNGATIYDFSVFRPTQDNISRHIFISASFILGTLEGGINITSNGDYCQTPDTGTSLGFDYCALNKFNFAMQTTGD